VLSLYLENEHWLGLSQNASYKMYYTLAAIFEQWVQVHGKQDNAI
jgi:hypothetical protein